MNENFLLQLLQEINYEKIRYGTCDLKLTFHDGKIQYYEILICKRKNILPAKKEGVQVWEK